ELHRASSGAADEVVSLPPTATSYDDSLPGGGSYLYSLFAVNGTTYSYPDQRSWSVTAVDETAMSFETRDVPAGSTVVWMPDGSLAVAGELTGYTCGAPYWGTQPYYVAPGAPPSRTYVTELGSRAYLPGVVTDPAGHLHAFY